MKRITRSAASWTFVPPSDRDLPPEQQTTFTLRPLTITERAHYHDNLTRTSANGDGGSVVLSRTRQVSVEIVLNQVIAIENFPVGAPEPWPKELDARITYLEKFDDDDLEAIADEIWLRSKLGVPEKNSSPPGRTSSLPDALATMPSTTAPHATETPVSSSP